MKLQSRVQLQWLNAAAKINASRENFKEKLKQIYPARRHRQRWNNSKQQKVTLLTCLYLCLCAYECVACALIWHTQGKQIQTGWQAKMWRESRLSPHVLWQSASGGSEPACPLLLHMTPLCIGRPGLRALTKPPWSSYICLTCQSGTQPCQRKFTACMNNKLKPKRSYSSTTVSRDYRGVPFIVRVYLCTWNQTLLIHACLSCYQKYFTTTGYIAMKICTNILDPKWITPNGVSSTFPLVPPWSWHLWFKYFDICWMDCHEICYRYSMSLEDYL